MIQKAISVFRFLRGICLLLLVLTLSISSSAQNILGEWRMEQDLTSPINSLNGLGINSPTYSTSHRQGLYSVVLSSTQYIDLQNPSVFPSGSASRTITAWAATSDLTGIKTFFSYGNITNQSLSIGQNGSSLVVVANGSAIFTVANFWALNVWHHIALTFDGATAKLYADGALVGTATPSINTTLSLAYIGRNVNGSENWVGSIDDVRVYSGVVALTDILYMVQVATIQVAWWTFDNSDLTELFGISTTPNGSPSPGYSIDSRVGSHSLLLDGVTQFASAGNPSTFPTGTNSRSIAAWAKTNLTSSTRDIFSYGTAATNQSMYIGQNGTSLVAGAYGNVLTVPSFWTTGVWHHICLTYDGVTARLYADGVLVTSANMTWSLVGSTTNIGRDVFSGNFWSGNIDEVRVFASTLTLPEIQAMGMVPPVPGSFTATTTGPSTVNLSWTNTGSPCSFLMEQSTSSTGPFTVVSGTYVSPTSYTIGDLNEATNYYFRVRGQNNAGYGDYTSVLLSPTSAATPSMMTASAGSSTTATLTWIDNSSMETGYQIERSVTSGSGYSVVYTTAPNVVTYNNTGLTAGTTYYYRVKATGSTVYSNETSTTTLTTTQWTTRKSALTALAFQYQYDVKNRMVQKRVPGSGWVYMVYDLRDRLIMTQDSVQRPNNQWLVTKYDSLDRLVMTGVYTHGSQITQGVMAGLVNTGRLCEVYVGKTAAANHGYSNSVFPTSSLTILTVNYYDNYKFIPDLTLGTVFNYLNTEIAIDGTNNIPAQETYYDTLVMGHPTGSRVGVLGTSSFLTNATYYDAKFRVIQTISDNNKGGHDWVTNVVDFPGRVLKTKTTHKSLSSVSPFTAHPDQVITRRFVYDHMSRIKQTFHKLNSSVEILLTQNSYNEIGQLVMKGLHAQAGHALRQNVDYRYNIRGWLQSVNNAQLSNDGGVTNNDSNDLFGMELAYNGQFATGPSITVTSANPLQYNGNIWAMRWSQNAALSTVKDVAYNYAYDPLNRLTAATYSTDNVSSWGNTGQFNESGYTYDKNGNILGLTRKNSSGTTMDGLTYNYGTMGNQLQYVTDSGDATKGFVDVVSGNDYSYDGNGNMITDKNKGITGAQVSGQSYYGVISYNHLNLPSSVAKTTGENIKYTYDATGRKLQQRVYSATNVLQKTTDYAGEFIYQDNTHGDTLQFINHEEGRIVGLVSPTEYQYHLKDHLGNVRITFTAARVQDIYQAGYEDANISSETALFSPSYANAVKVNASLYNHTPGGSKSQRLSAANQNEIIGLAKSLKVVPGDTLDLSVFVKYTSTTGSSTNVAGLILASMSSAFGVNSGSTGDALQLYQSLNSLNGAGLLITSGGGVGGAPHAFLNYILFDQNFVAYDMGFTPVTTTALETGSGTGGMTLTIQARPARPGYAYIYISNENSVAMDTYFDDLKITHTRSPIVQGDDYYPFGLRFNSYFRANSVVNVLKLFQSQEHVDELGLDWDSFKWRNHQPEIGRFFNIDPLSDKYTFNSPYAFSENKVVLHRELEGLESSNTNCPECDETKNNPDGNAKPKFSGPERFWTSIPGAVSQASTAALTYSDVNDATVLATTLTRSGKAVNVDGTKATVSDKIFAGLGLFVPLASGSALKKLIVEGGGAAVDKILKKMSNISTHLTDKDVAGAARDILGNPVIRESDGYVYQHLDEVNKAMKGLGSELDNLNKAMKNLTGEALKDAEKIRSSVQKQKDEIRAFLDRAWDKVKN